MLCWKKNKQNNVVLRFIDSWRWLALHYIVIIIWKSTENKVVVVITIIIIIIIIIITTTIIIIIIIKQMNESFDFWEIL